MSEFGDKFLAAIAANKLTIDELEAVVGVLEVVKIDDTAKAALAKMRWHIAASRNEVEYS